MDVGPNYCKRQNSFGCLQRSDCCRSMCCCYHNRDPRKSHRLGTSCSRHRTTSNEVNTKMGSTFKPLGILMIVADYGHHDVFCIIITKQTFSLCVMASSGILSLAPDISCLIRAIFGYSTCISMRMGSAPLVVSTQRSYMTPSNRYEWMMAAARRPGVQFRIVGCSSSFRSSATKESRLDG